MEDLPGDPGRAASAAHADALFSAADKLIQRLWTHLPGVRHFGIAAPSARAILLAAIALLLLLIVPPVSIAAIRRLKHLEMNFRRVWIPQSAGMSVWIWMACVLPAAVALYPASRATCLLWLAGTGVFCGLGLLDDYRGDRIIKGLGGHLRAALRGRITTGFIKAVGGLLCAALIAWRLHGGHPVDVVIATAIIALSANAINLLDLRPGRAGALFLAASAAVIARAVAAGVFPLLIFVALPALPLYERDARARVMMGDAGSNLLGAALGMALVSPPFGRSAWAAALVLLVLLHIVAERLSLSKLIERAPILRALDRLTGER